MPNSPSKDGPARIKFHSPNAFFSRSKWALIIASSLGDIFSNVSGFISFMMQMKVDISFILAESFSVGAHGVICHNPRTHAFEESPIWWLIDIRVSTLTKLLTSGSVHLFHPFCAIYIVSSRRGERPDLAGLLQFVDSFLNTFAFVVQPILVFFEFPDFLFCCEETSSAMHFMMSMVCFMTQFIFTSMATCWFCDIGDTIYAYKYIGKPIYLLST